MTLPSRPAIQQLPVRPEWLGTYQEDPLDPELPIIDAHHHLWHHESHRYLVDEYLEDLYGGHNVTASVFMECKAMYRSSGEHSMRPVGEVEFANGVGAIGSSGRYGNTRLCAGIVAYADLALGDAIEPVLKAQIAAAPSRFRGIRNISAWHDDPTARGSAATPPPGLLLSDAFRQGFAHLQPLGLTYDAWLYHTQLNELIDLARHFCTTPIILNHVGGPIGIGPYRSRRQEVFEQWRTSMKKLSLMDNVFVKLGGLGMRLFGFDFHERDRPPTSLELCAAWKPYIETCIELFGTSRTMFESNFPVDKGTCSYTILWNAFKRIAHGSSDDERRQLFHGTAAHVYRLES